MLYYICFDERTDKNLNVARLAEEAGTAINLAAYMDGTDIVDFQNDLSGIAKGLQPADEIVTSYEPLNWAVREAVARGVSIDYDKLNQLSTVFIRFFLDGKFKKRDWISPGVDTVSSWSPGLYVRYGIVELRVVDNWIRRPEELKKEYTETVKMIRDEDYFHRPAGIDHWLSAGDVNFNLRKLMTNAGFYPSANANDPSSLNYWAQEYFHALAQSTGVFPCPGCYPFFFVVQEELYKKGFGLRRAIGFPSPNSFYPMLSEKRILLLTPFHAQIGELYETGKIYQLYSDISIPRFDLTLLPAFISIFPNRPHGSWLETFERLKDEVDRAFAIKNFNVFFASCGCYGLPICKYVYEKYECASVYFGNHVNTLFGVRQSCNENFMPEHRIIANWVSSHLSQIKGVSRIDNGRYV